MGCREVGSGLPRALAAPVDASAEATSLTGGRPAALRPCALHLHSVSARKVPTRYKGCKYWLQGKMWPVASITHELVSGVGQRAAGGSICRQLDSHQSWMGSLSCLGVPEGRTNPGGCKSEVREAQQQSISGR